MEYSKNILKFSRLILPKIPSTYGVYLFLDKNKLPIYIGKSIDLKKRFLSHLKDTNDKTKSFLEKSYYYAYIKLQGEFEAIIFESHLIKKYMPKYNVLSKDGRSHSFIVITDDPYPRVLIKRGSDLEIGKESYGPFLSFKEANSVYKTIRKIFPFSVHLPFKKECIQSQLGLCNPCPSLIEQSDAINRKLHYSKYTYNIKCVRSILKGRISSALRDLTLRLNDCSKNKRYEDAIFIRNQISYLKRINLQAGLMDYLPTYSDSRRLNQYLSKSLEFLNKYQKVEALGRIECFDISHYSGEYTTGSMVTFIDGIPDKSLYRKFRLRTKPHSDDVLAMSEIAARRSRHLVDWGSPDLILVDGGVCQIKAFIKEFGCQSTPIIGLEKREERLVFLNNGKTMRRRLPKNNAGFLFIRIRDEAHRFANSYRNLLYNKRNFV